MNNTISCDPAYDIYATTRSINIINEDISLGDYMNVLLTHQKSNYFSDNKTEEYEKFNYKEILEGIKHMFEPLKYHARYMYDTINWIGYVETIGDDSFTAKLYEDNNPIYEIAEFAIKDVSSYDKELIKNGAIFYWSIGYDFNLGQVTRTSMLRFKRSVNYITSELFDKALDEADKLLEELQWD